VSICGVPEKAWPYACSIDDTNGVRYDPDSGTLWVRPALNEFGAMVELYPAFPADTGLIPYNTWTPINWKSASAADWFVRRDVGSSTQNWVCQTPIEYATRLTCPDDPCFAGWYECVLNVKWGLPTVYTTPPANSIRQIGIRLNGSGSGGAYGTSGGGILFVGCYSRAPLLYPLEQIYVREIYLRPGDFVQAMAFHSVPSVTNSVYGSLSLRWKGRGDPNTVGGGVGISGQNATTAYPSPPARSGSCP